MRASIISWPEAYNLSDLDRVTLLLVVQNFAAQPFKLEQLERLSLSGREVSGAELRAGLASLRKKSLVSAVRKAWGERLYYLTGKVLTELQDGMLGPLQQADGKVRVEREGGDGAEMDLFRILVWTGKQGLPLTAKGTIHQKVLNKLTGLISLSADDMKYIQLHYPHPEAYSAEIAVVLDLLLSFGLLMRRGRIELNEETLTKWLNRSRAGMRTAIYEQVLSRYLPADPVVQQWVYSLHSRAIEEGHWYRCTDVLTWLQSHQLIKGELTEDQRNFMSGWLDFLCGVGFVDLGISGEGQERAFRWRTKLVPFKISDEDSDSSGASGKFFVQPDMEVLVPADVPYTVRWELELCLESRTYDVMSVYRLSRHAAIEALEHGRLPSDILSLLETHAESGIPDNVRAALEQWARELGRTSLEERILLRCSDAGTADIIATHFGSKSELERIGPLDFLVLHQNIADIRTALEQLELIPRKSGAKSADDMLYPKLKQIDMLEAEASTNQATEFQGWIMGGTPLHIYEQDHDVPSIEELFPGLEEVPTAWYKELRAYHSSTAKALIQQAITWRTKIALHLGGETVECLPLKIHEQESWRVEVQIAASGQQCQLSSSEWDSIRLLMPKVSV